MELCTLHGESYFPILCKCLCSVMCLDLSWKTVLTWLLDISFVSRRKEALGSLESILAECGNWGNFRQ